MLVEELNTASRLLDQALQRYTNACSALEKCTVTRPLFDRLQGELATVTSYKARMRQAEISLSRTRNSPSPLVMINSLPPEILSRIFQLVTSSSTQNCIGEDVKDVRFEDETFPEYPEILSHICSRWREILISCGSIWTHIDLVPFHQFSRGLLTRAKTFVSRATSHSLIIHIVDPVYKNHAIFDIPEFLQFLTSAAPKMRSLELITRSDDRLFHCLILETCLASSVPGTLERANFHVSDGEDNAGHNLIESVENPHSSSNLLLDVPHQHLEDVWHSTTSLNLNLFYPHWASKAYHGLVELCLSAMDPVISCPWPTEAQFINILSSSPRLRILRFKFQLADQSPKGEFILPVRLDDLEILDLGQMDSDQIANFLRLIAPGPNPLDLSIDLERSGPHFSIFADEVRSFFARSNLTRFFMKDPPGYRWVDIAFNLLPSLEYLGLESFVCDRQFPQPDASNYQSTPAEPRHFNTLHILSSSIDLKRLRWMIQDHMVQKLELWNCCISLDGRKISNEEVRSFLSDTGVVVICDERIPITN